MNRQQKFEEFKNSTTVNVNGQVVPAEHATIPVFDRGFLYGDSIYEVTYSEQGRLIFFDEHLERLYNSASLLNMTIFLDKEFIIQQIMKTLKHSKLERAYVRVIITRGETEITLDPNASFKNNFIIIVKPQPRYAEILYQKGLHLVISSVLRNDRKSINPNAKSGNYLNNVMAMHEAKEMGADDAIMVNHEGLITEGTTFNIWLIKDQVIKTPPEKNGLLKGITRSKVLEICKSQNLPHSISEITPDMLLAADEVFITSSTKGIMPVFQINQTLFKQERPVTNQLMSFYQELLNQEITQKKYYYL